MLTLFSPGDEVQAQHPFKLREGSIYVFSYLGEMTIHRLIKFDEDKLIFKGDFSLTAEGISFDAIFGKVDSPFEEVFLFLSRFYQKDRARIVRGAAKIIMLALSKLI